MLHLTHGVQFNVPKLTSHSTLPVMLLVHQLKQFLHLFTKHVSVLEILKMVVLFNLVKAIVRPDSLMLKALVLKIV